MYRIRIKYGQEMLSTTPLTARILRRAGRPIEVIEQPDSENPGENGFRRFDWEESVATKQQVLANWRAWSSEEIIERLDYLRSIQKSDMSKSELDQTLDLWLLRALAQEKSLYTEFQDIQETYHHCRQLGRWNAVLIKNNLAVIKAKRRECLDSLNLLADAIELSLRNELKLKAPFYNAALVFHQLDQAGLLNDERYTKLLNRIARMIKVPEQPAKIDIESAKQPEVSENRAFINPPVAYRKIAQYGFDLVEPKPEKLNLYERSISYLTPNFDLFESFGDFTDKTDPRTAYDFIERGIALADEERFDEAIDNFTLAPEFDPAFSPESSLRVEQVSELWRLSRNQSFSTYVGAEKHEDAQDVIESLDERLKRPNDATVVTITGRLKHGKQVYDADRLFETREAENIAKAKVLYIGLLKEDDLGEALRIHASHQLIATLYECDDDRDRHNRLDELIVNNAHPDEITRFSDKVVRKLIQDSHVLLEAGNHEMAIQKFLWAMLLPNQTRRREELFQAALFAMDQLLKSERKLSDCESLKDPIFSALIVELSERWNLAQDKEATAKFEKLDNEPWLIRKQFDELLALLDQLSARAPTTKYLVNKLRLQREKEAQKLFASIQQQLNSIAQKGDHSKRREGIEGDLRQLSKVAADFAGGSRQRYADQIRDFIEQAEAYLLDADQQQFMNDLDLEIDARHEKQVITLRQMIKENEDQLKILQAIGAALNRLQETRFFPQVQRLAVYWFERQAKTSLRSLTDDDPKRAREVLEASRSSLEKNHQVLPEEFKVSFTQLISELVKELGPQPRPARASSGTAPPDEPATPPSPPRTTEKKGRRRVADWFKSVCGIGRQS